VTAATEGLPGAILVTSGEAQVEDVRGILGDQSSYVTGSHLDVDGGLGATAHIEA
jgi:hypothetical protein